MSAPFGPIALTLGEITKQIRGTFEAFIDPRTGKNTTYGMVDAGPGAFSVFFMQSPSFLEHQRTLEQAHGENNARTLFGVHEIPSADNQLRTLLDPTPPAMASLPWGLGRNGTEKAVKPVTAPFHVRLASLSALGYK
jgi:hypothetical protein